MRHPLVLQSCTRGPLISIDGITGVGKTYLTRCALDGPAGVDDRPLTLDGFSNRRSGEPGLGDALLQSLRNASGGDPFLRGGTPLAEALLLVAIKRYDLDIVLPDLARGRTVIEGRSIDSTAVCQALLLHPDDAEKALGTAVALLELAATFRPLPDLTILITDDAAAAVERAERRDQRSLTGEQVTFMHRAGLLFERLAAIHPARFRIVDRRTVARLEAVELIRTLISSAGPGLGCISEPCLGSATPCMFCGRTTEPGRT